MSITNGTVKFSKRVNRGNYEHEEAGADISFLVPEGEDYRAALQTAQGEAMDVVYRMLGLRSDAAPMTEAKPEAKPVTKRAAKAAAVDPLASHASDCATHNEPAMAAEACDCDLPPVSDADLTAFVAKKNGELIVAYGAKNNGDGRSGTQLMKDCIAEFSASEPPSVRGIPVERRREFMEKAKALS